MGTRFRHDPWSSRCIWAGSFLLAAALWPAAATAYEAVPIDDTFLEHELHPDQWSRRDAPGRRQWRRAEVHQLHQVRPLEPARPLAPAALTPENIQRATLKLFVNEVAADGSFEIRQVLNDEWDEDDNEDPGTGAFVRRPHQGEKGEEYRGRVRRRGFDAAGGGPRFDGERSGQHRPGPARNRSTMKTANPSMSISTARRATTPATIRAWRSCWSR